MIYLPHFGTCILMQKYVLIYSIFFFNSKFIPISSNIYNIKHNKKEDNENYIEGMTKGQRGP